jgi:uncharacterized protein
MNSKHSINDLRALIRKHFDGLAARYAVESLALFGSRVRGDDRADSDLDVLVRFRTAPTLFRLIELEDELSDLLGVQVDLVLHDSLKPAVAESVAADLVPV